MVYVPLARPPLFLTVTSYNIYLLGKASSRLPDRTYGFTSCICWNWHRSFLVAIVTIATAIISLRAITGFIDCDIATI